MTTKKQRRAQVAAKTAERREADRLLNLELLRIAREKRERSKYEAERSTKKRKAPIPENLTKSMASIG
jgi:hypothetical protein